MTVTGKPEPAVAEAGAPVSVRLEAAAELTAIEPLTPLMLPSEAETVCGRRSST